MTQVLKCEGESCETNFKDKELLFKMRKSGVQGFFCFSCVTQLKKSDGWQMKSRESLARYKDMTGEDFVPYEDPGKSSKVDLDEQSPINKLMKSFDSLAAYKNPEDSEDLGLAQDSPINRLKESLIEVGSHHKARNLVYVLEELAESSTGEPMPKLLEKLALLDNKTDS
jgi:hypothetical protein